MQAIAHEKKLVKLGQITLDGTKIKTNTSKYKAPSYDHAQKIEAQLKEEIKTLITREEVANREAIPHSMNIPTEIARRETLLEGGCK